MPGFASVTNVSPADFVAFCEPMEIKAVASLRFEHSVFLFADMVSTIKAIAVPVFEPLAFCAVFGARSQDAGMRFADSKGQEINS